MQEKLTVQRILEMEDEMREKRLQPLELSTGNYYLMYVGDNDIELDEQVDPTTLDIGYACELMGTIIKELEDAGLSIDARDIAGIVGGVILLRQKTVLTTNAF